MKTTGILGGMSWQSTAHYYRLINEETARLRGGLRSAPLLISSVDFHEIEALQRRGDWQAAGAILAGEARKLEAAGAELLVLATNTMHKVAQAIIDSVSVPLLHIAEATRDAAVHAGYRRLGLLGTRFTMEEAFYTDRLVAGTDMSVLLPDPGAREEIDRIIFSELCLGTIREASRAVYRSAIEDLVARGAEAVILGCTEIGMLISRADTDTPLLDTTAIHAQAAVRHALEPGPVQAGGAS